MTPDWRLQFVTSGSGDRTVAAAVAAARGGAGIVQVRAKELLGGELLELVCRVADAVAAAAPSSLVTVNDRVDVAVAARRRGARVHGVHLGQADFPVDEARWLLGEGALVGLTAGTLDFAREAESRVGAGRPDYLGAGPFRPTPTKDVGRPPVGLAGYRDLVAATSLPVVAIGDVRRGDVADLATTGVAGVAMVREVMEATDAEGLVCECLATWDGTRS
ncbi:thiamine-phosphate pyrophosphorylase [Knoellia subterranea KCTC 19937]|uniref:Thiamine-phosphate synthase n=1 Tax=Knoellia subterranea KCTC 19937 TaxID=1385521 RepID=A0A0A0JNL3_9MICO|nr:thiamine-phosphate pyrophosphorylase [Knoellia subterranea KCTC 19937]